MFNHINYKTETVIRADAETVYNILTNFQAYPEWNPWVSRVEGNAELGSVVAVDATLGKRKVTVNHEILELEKGKVLRWGDVEWFSKVACGRRVRTIEPISEGLIRYRNEMPMTGLLAWLANILSGKDVVYGMNLENIALKHHAESMVS